MTGIDLSSAILNEAERIVNAEGLANVELRKMDAEHLEFPDQSFDVVTCAFSLFLFPDIEAALRDMYRVCKRGGYIGVTLSRRRRRPSIQVGQSCCSNLWRMEWECGCRSKWPIQSRKWRLC